MKAVIMEIRKGYCIILTRDGRFLKQVIPPGVFEVGDEITVSEEYVYKTKRIDISRVKTLSLAASIIIILATVSFFSFWYLKHYTASRSADAESVGVYVAEEEAEVADADADAEMIVEEKVTEAVEKRTIIFEETYYFREQEEAEEDIEDTLSISYKIIDDISLRIKLRNISSASKFDGTLTMVMYLSDGSESQAETVSIDELEPGEVTENPLFLKTEEVKLKVQITGSTY